MPEREHASPDRFPLFDESYLPPIDHEAAETLFRRQFSQQHPKVVPLLGRALSEIRRFVRMTPGYAGGAPHSTKLFVHPDSIADMTVPAGVPLEERVLARDFIQGDTVIGDMPPATHDLIEGLYRLTGARIIPADRRKQGADSGVILRRAYYHGLPFFFEERFERNSSRFDGQSVFELSLLTPLAAADQQRFDKTSLQEQRPALPVSERLRQLGRRALRPFFGRS